MGKYNLKIDRPIHFKITQGEANEIQKEIATPRKPNSWDTISHRRSGYGSVADQLDQIWHDINNGKIVADTTSEDTWYAKIKQIKGNYPISTDPNEFIANTGS